MASALEAVVNYDKDHVVILDLGPAKDVRLAVESIAKRFEPIERRAVVTALPPRPAG